MLTLNFFFLPPVGTFTIADPQNWVALFAFLVVAVIASNLSAAAQARAREAVASRNEVTRLFDLTRDVLLTTETADAIDALARHVARRFELAGVAICLPADDGWRVHQGGSKDVTRRFGGAEYRARQGARHARVRRAATRLRRPPADRWRGRGRAHRPAAARHQAVGLLAAVAPALDLGALDAVAGVVAIAIERTQFLAEREAAELVRQKADLAATLLASLSHDLKTPLTAIRVAVENLRGDLPAAEREAQAGAALMELDRLTRLFQDILDMARIDAAAIHFEPQWVTPADVVDAASPRSGTSSNGHRPARRRRRPDRDRDRPARGIGGVVAPARERGAVLARRTREIEVDARVQPDGLHVAVTDHGPASTRANWTTCSSASIAAVRHGQRVAGHRNGARHHPRPADRRRRSGLGRERARRGRTIHDRRVPGRARSVRGRD